MNGLRIFQEPALIHLTGINQPKVILVLNPVGIVLEAADGRHANRKSSSSPEGPGKEFWDGIRFGYPERTFPQGRKGLEELRALPASSDIRPSANFRRLFPGAGPANRPSLMDTALYHSLPPRPLRREAQAPGLEARTDHNWAFKSTLEKLAREAAARASTVRTIVRQGISSLRLPLDPTRSRTSKSGGARHRRGLPGTLARLSPSPTRTSWPPTWRPA